MLSSATPPGSSKTTDQEVFSRYPRSGSYFPEHLLFCLWLLDSLYMLDIPYCRVFRLSVCVRVRVRVHVCACVRVCVCVCVCVCNARLHSTNQQTDYFSNGSPSKIGCLFTVIFYEECQLAKYAIGKILPGRGTIVCEPIRLGNESSSVDRSE